MLRFLLDDAHGRVVPFPRDGTGGVPPGYPKDLPRLEASLAQIGRRVSDVSAVVLTHAHMDHIGDSARWRREHGTRVLVWEPEVPLARGDIRQMISRPRVLSHIFEPGAARAFLRVMGALRLHHILFWEGEPVPDPEPFDGTAPLDLPGGLVPIPTPGHTSGHCAYHLPARGVLITGDSLVTEDFPRCTQPPEPQLMHPDFDHDYAQVLETVQRLRDIAAGVIIPGHGMPYYGSPASAVTHALERVQAEQLPDAGRAGGPDVLRPGRGDPPGRGRFASRPRPAGHR